MENPQYREFDARLRRIESIRSGGGGFEAAGTLGQSHYTRLRQRSGRSGLLRPVIVAVSLLELSKGLMLAANGTDAYAERVASLEAGSLLERIGGFLLAIDPVATVLAGPLGPLFG